MIGDQARIGLSPPTLHNYPSHQHKSPQVHTWLLLCGRPSQHHETINAIHIKRILDRFIQQSINHARVRPITQELTQLLKHHRGREQVTSRHEVDAGQGHGSAIYDDGVRTLKAGARGGGTPSSSWLGPSLLCGGGLGGTIEMDDDCMDEQM